MAIIGTLIKKAIELSQAFTDTRTPMVRHREQLHQLLSSAKDTAFGKYYGFAPLLEAAAAKVSRCYLAGQTGLFCAELRNDWEEK